MTDVIIVEDNKLDIHLLKRIFSKNLPDIQYTFFMNGAEALVHFENQLNPLPKLFLLDIKVPMVNGLVLLKKLKTMPHTKYIPVVMLSSSNQQQDIETAYQNGSNGFITKVGDYNQYKPMISTTISYWINYNKTI